MDSLPKVSSDPAVFDPFTAGLRFIGMNYKSKKWLRLRESILKRDNYLCQESKRYGRIVEATTVHHILPVSDYPQYRYMPWNLISLCAAEHNRMHDRETNELTADGQRLAEKVLKNFVNKN